MLNLPEPPPALTDLQLLKMTIEELKIEQKQRYQIFKQVDDLEKQVTRAWLDVCRHIDKRETTAKLRAEIISEMQANTKTS